MNKTKPSSDKEQTNAVQAFNDKNDMEQSFTTNTIGSEVEQQVDDIKSKDSLLEEEDTSKTADDTKESSISN